MQVIQTERNPNELCKTEKSDIENFTLKPSDIIKKMAQFEQMNDTQITKITDAMINKTEETITNFEQQNEERVATITDAMINKTKKFFSRFEEKNDKMGNVFSTISNLIAA